MALVVVVASSLAYSVIISYLVVSRKKVKGEMNLVE